MFGRRRRLWRLGVGAGLVGAAALAARYLFRAPATVAVPDSISPAVFATKVLHTSGGPVVYHESGAGCPAVFVHGVYVGASSYEWSKVYPAFAAGHRVLALDLVGFGESARPPVPLEEGEYVRVLAEFCRAVTHDAPPVLVASGMGAGFCGLLASQHPDLVSRLILWMPSAAAGFGRRKAGLWRRVVRRVPVVNRMLYYRRLATWEGVKRWLATEAFASPSRVSDEMVEVMANCAQQYGAERCVMALQSGGARFDLVDRLRGLSVPMTLMWPEGAWVPPVEHGRAIVESAPRAALRVMEGASPLWALEEPERMVAALRAELDGGLRLV